MKTLQKQIASELRWAAAGYARAGMGLMLAATGLGRNAQAAIGNLAVATELLLKAFIASRNLTLLLKDLPMELRCALLAPDKMPEGFRSQPYEIELKASTYKSLELDEAIATASIFIPDIKKRLGSHLRYLARHRNTCLHAVLPDCRQYEVERTAFLLLSLVKLVETHDGDLLRYSNWGDKEKNDAFLTRFDEDRLNGVHKKVEAAREKAKGLSGKSHSSPDEWDWYPLECPVCGSDGVVHGETEADRHYREDGIAELNLVFLAEWFECDQCGLQLEDYDEMQIAGMNVDDIDRNDEVDKWRDEHYRDYDDYEP
ncbi:MAG: hypothetical protein NTZ28_06685 [Nitrospirae bacterium]|nr:hypothetical protein [Nitrospirota bacterium]